MKHRYSAILVHSLQLLLDFSAARSQDSEESLVDNHVHILSVQHCHLAFEMRDLVDLTWSRYCVHTTNDNAVFWGFVTLQNRRPIRHMLFVFCRQFTLLGICPEASVP